MSESPFPVYPRFGAGSPKITFIGASYKFVHRVMRDMILAGGFEKARITIHDLDEVPLKHVGDLIERMIAQAGISMEVKRTLSQDEALSHSDAVILSITTGGMEADARSSEIAFKHGIPTCIGDTLGPAALMRNLRCVPVAVELIKNMERLCPNAVMLNFTNPMSCITGAMAQNSSLPVWGLCHSIDGMADYFAAIFDVSKERIEMKAAGVNHQSFVVSLKIDGEERVGEILQRSQNENVTLKDELVGSEENLKMQQTICRHTGCWPTTGHSHGAEFYGFFDIPVRFEEYELHHDIRYPVIPGREKIGRRPWPDILDKWTYGPDPVEDMDKLTSEHAHELLWSALSGDPITRSFNLLNTEDYVTGLPKTSCVEVIATLENQKISAEPLTLPPVIHSLVSRWTTIHQLSIDAALNCDREALRQALFLDPHVKDLNVIDPMIEDMMTHLAEWLPSGW